MNKPQPKKSHSEVQQELAKAHLTGLRRTGLKPKSPEAMKEISLAQNKATRAYAQANRFGTVHQTFIEHHAFEKSFMGYVVDFKNRKAGKPISEMKKAA